jgi:hypothetical protein
MPGEIHKDHLIKRNCLSRDLLHPLDGLGASIGQVIHHHHIVSVLQQFHYSVGTNIAGTAGDQNLHAG